MTGRGSLLLVLVALFAVGASAVRGLHRGLPAHYSWHQDEIAPLRALGFLERYADPDPRLVDKYTPAAYLYFAIPARIALALRGDAQAAELLEKAKLRGANAWPRQFDPDVQVEHRPQIHAITDCLVAGRLAAAFAGVMAALGAALLARRLFATTGPTPGVAALAAPLAALVVGFSPYVAYYSHTMNNDGPAFGVLMLGLAAFASAWDRGRPATFLAGASGALLALASAIKDQVAILAVFLPVAVLLAEHLRSRRGARRAMPWRDRLVACLAFAATYALAANWIFDFDGWLRHVRFGMSDEITEQYKMAEPLTLSGWFHLVAYTGAYLVRAAGPGGLLLMIAGAIHGWRRHREAFLLLALPALAYYLLYPYRRGVIYPRFLVPVFLPLLLMGVGAVIACGRDAARRRSRWLFVAGLACCGAIVHRGLTLDSLFVGDPREQATRWLANEVPAGTRVLIVGNHAVPPPFIPDGLPHRWAHAKDFDEALREFEPQIILRMLSTNLRTVIVPQFPFDRSEVVKERAEVLAEFGREFYVPELRHPLLLDIDASPGVMAIRADPRAGQRAGRGGK
jgi:hypothetical protein